MPPVDLAKMLGHRADSACSDRSGHRHPRRPLRRRPDVRQAERLAAAQAEQIGIAQADLYPAIFVNGSLGYSAAALSRSVHEASALRQRRARRSNGTCSTTAGSSTPFVSRTRRSRNWSSRISRRCSAARKSRTASSLSCGRSSASNLLDESVEAAKEAVDIVDCSIRAGRRGDFNRYTLIEQNLLHAAGFVGAGPGQHRPGADSDLPRVGWRLGNAALRRSTAERRRGARCLPAMPRRLPTVSSRFPRRCRRRRTVPQPPPPAPRSNPMPSSRRPSSGAASPEPAFGNAEPAGQAGASRPPEPNVPWLEDVLPPECIGRRLAGAGAARDESPLSFLQRQHGRVLGGRHSGQNASLRPLCSSAPIAEANIRLDSR